MGDKRAESLWVRIRGQTLMGVCCRLPGQEEVDEAFFRQLEKASDLE